MTMRASYREAIAWIAENDEPSFNEVEDIASTLTVLLIADLWRKEPEEVARAVIRYRKKQSI